MTYTVLIYEAEPEEGRFWATVAELPGCYTQGETIEEVEENVKDAIEAGLHALKDAGEPLPEPAVRKLEIAVA
jgi:predicted RNase H-like HicB family nuclease